ncbi:MULTISPECIES: ABC transporter permease [Pseudofrankia]|uniref:ABC transporter permease n=1 Tax=Pseudofrankia TaxID=2994363 RepID=UPI000234B131|nr:MULTISPECIES: ABC transporter permease [Pseudofrankia]OHV28973.1 ABC transporter [Pseudofrankia sp. EUN1h]
MSEVALLRPAPVGDTLAMAGRALRLTLRDPVTFVLAAFFPLILLLLMTVSFAKVVYPGAGYDDYVDISLPLFVLMGIAFASPFTAAATASDLRDGFDARIRTMPVSAFAPLAGRVLADTARSAITIAVVVAVGVPLGFRFTAGPWAAIGFLLLPLLFGLGLGFLGLLVAMRSRDAETVVAVLNPLLLVCSFLSTGLVPRAELPGWVQPIARVNPFSVVIEAMRALAHGGATTRPVLEAVAWSVVLIVGCGVLAVRGYRSRSDRLAG